MNNNVIRNEQTGDFTVERLFEKCVMCDKQTNVPIDLHVDYRSHYVEGAGQLCFECYTSKLEYIKE